MRTNKALDGREIETVTAEYPEDENFLLLLSFLFSLFLFLLFFFCVYGQLYQDLQRAPTIEELAVGLEVTAEQVKGYDLAGFSSSVP